MVRYRQRRVEVCERRVGDSSDDDGEIGIETGDGGRMMSDGLAEVTNREQMGSSARPIAGAS